MCLEPPVFLCSQRGDEFAGLSRSDDGDIAGKGLVAPDMVVVIVTVDYRANGSGKQSCNSRPKVSRGLRGNKGIENEHSISQVDDARVALGQAALCMNSGKDTVCQLVHAEMCRRERTHPSLPLSSATGHNGIILKCLTSISIS